VGKAIREQIEPALRHLEAGWLDAIAGDDALYSDEKEHFAGEVARIFKDMRVRVGKIWAAKRIKRNDR